MFEQRRVYPTAVTGEDLDWQEADRLAVQWVWSQHSALGGHPLLLYPTARQRSDHPFLDRLEDAPGVVSTTWRSLLRAGWRGGVVLAAWPDLQHLNQIADDRRTRALCVLTWNASQTSPWASAVGAEVLGGAGESLASPPIEDVVVLRAMESVTVLVNMNNTLKAGYEKDVAGSALLILKDHGHEIDSTALFTWAVAKGWPARRAEELRDLAARIVAGSRPRVRQGVLRADIYSVWRNPEAPGSD